MRQNMASGNIIINKASWTVSSASCRVSVATALAVFALLFSMSMGAAFAGTFVRPDENAFLYRFQPIEKFYAQHRSGGVPAAWPIFYHRTLIPPRIPHRMELLDAAERLAVPTPTRSTEDEVGATAGPFGEPAGGIDKRRAPLEMLLKDLWQQQEVQDVYEPMRFGLAGR